MRCLAAGVVLVMAVAGCSGSEAAPAEVGPLGSGAASASPTTVASALATASPRTSATSPVQGGGSVDVAPTVGNEQAASAFTRRFFDVVNEAYAQNDAADIRRLSAPSCGSCVAVAKDVERLAVEQHLVAGSRYILSSAEAAPTRADGQVVVDFRFDSDPYVEVDLSGVEVKRFPAETERDGQILVSRSATGDLLVAAIRLVD